MNISALAGTAIGSAVVGTLAAGWLVTLTPLPVYVARPVEAAAPMRFASVADAPPAVERASVAATSSLASAPSPQPPRTVAPPPMPSGLSSRPMSARAAGFPVKRHLAKVAMILPSMHSRDGASQPQAAAKPRLAGALTPSEINRIRVSLRLSPEQEAQWSPVAGILRQLARRQMAALKNGEEPSLGSTSDLMHFYSTAQPLLRNLREDQKVEVRALARRMGFGSLASYI